MPRSRIPEMVARLHEISQANDIPIVVYGHIGDGNLHPTLLCDRRDAAIMQRAAKAAGELLSTAVALGGTVTGEHRIGVFERDHIREGLDAEHAGVHGRGEGAVRPKRRRRSRARSCRRSRWWLKVEGERLKVEGPATCNVLFNQEEENMATTDWRGTAIPMTPFDERDRIDEDVLAAEIDFCVASGVGGIVVPVMVSEFQALSKEERRLMIRIPVEVARPPGPQARANRGELRRDQHAARRRVRPLRREDRRRRGDRHAR